jgi:quercetin dioxygenase-like cupin family protein
MPDNPLSVLAEKLQKMAGAPAAPAPAAVETPFGFASGLPDCCTASPDLYKTIAEIPGVARLVKMTFPPGAKDAPHEHPVHSMFFITDAKLKISGPPTPTKLGEEGGVAEIPAGAAPIFPAMAHQVENVGEAEGQAIFVEAFPNCKPCGDVEGYISPFAVSPGCYKSEPSAEARTLD